MERHKCKLCPRNFANGKALGGHMKAHLATLPLPPKKKPQLSNDSDSASASDSDEYEESEGPLIYGLRENPRKSFRFADPEFSFVVDAGSVVQDRESEAEAENEPRNNPTRRRSKRNWAQAHRPRPAEVDPEQVSSVSDASPEENVAMCLMMLSRDQWLIRTKAKDKDKSVFPESEPEEEKSRPSKSRKIRGKYQCDKCKRMFRSHQALGSHRVTHKAGPGAGASRAYECPFCYKVFGSGQALGGHKRSHVLLGTSSANAASSSPPKKLFTSIDLNMPAPVEEDSYSVVSDAYESDPVRFGFQF